MKLNTLEKIKMALENLKPEVTMNESIRKRAQVPLERMMTLTQGGSVEWPKAFSISKEELALV